MLLAGVGLGPRAFAQAKPHRIDVHHHVAPPVWLSAMDVIGRTNPPLATWSIQKSLDDMDKGGIATSLLSPTAPQVVPLGKPVAVKIARDSNEVLVPVDWDLATRRGQALTLAVEDELTANGWSFIGLSGFDVIRDR